MNLNPKRINSNPNAATPSDSMVERLAAFSEKYEFEDQFTEALHMSDMMQFVLASKVSLCAVRVCSSCSRPRSPCARCIQANWRSSREFRV